MDDKIIKELKEIAEKFDRGVYVLNIQKAQEISSLRANHFASVFSNALHEFKIAKPPAELGTFRTTTYYADLRDYNQKCNNFHLAVTTARTMDLFLNKIALDEQEDYKKRCGELEAKLTEAKTKIETLTEEKGFLKGKLAMYERDTPKSDTIESDVTHE